MRVLCCDSQSLNVGVQAFHQSHLYGEGQILVKEWLANKSMVRCCRLEEDQRQIEAFHGIPNRYAPDVLEAEFYAGAGMVLWALLLEAISPRVQSIWVGFERNAVLPGQMIDLPALK